MRKKFIFLLALALALTTGALAQRDTIGVSKFTAIYRYECKTADADGQPVTDSMYIAVQTSGGITKSFPYDEYDRQKKGGSRIADGYQAAQMHMGTIFVNHPEGRITSQEMLYPYRYMTDEPLEKHDWTLTNAQDSICGYACLSATTKYHGMTWNAYFTEDVPASIGPWKLGGLPGLITKIADAKGIHTFTLCGLQREELPMLLTKYVTWVVPDGQGKFAKQRVDYQEETASAFLAYKKKVLGNRRYLKDPTYYAPDPMTAFGYVETSYSPTGNQVSSVAGVVIVSNPHVYQPLEMAGVQMQEEQEEQEEQEVAQFVAVYDYECRTLDAEGDSVVDRMQMVVQVGRRVTKSMPLSCYKQGEWNRDRLATAYQEAMMHLPTVWTGWPEGQTTVREFIFPHEFGGSEPTPDIQWTLTDDTLSVGGYPCHLAKAKFRGVEWTAWYTEEIPSSAGPWRLRGLPGLIIKAESKAHSFVLAELKDETTPITVPDDNPDVQRMSYAKLLTYRNGVYGNRQYVKNPYYYVPDLQSSLNEVFVYNHGGRQLAFANGGHPLLTTMVHEYRPLEAAIEQERQGSDELGTDASQFVVAYDWVTRTTDRDGRDETDSVRLAVIVGNHTVKCLEYNRAMMEDFGEFQNKDYQLGEWNARRLNLPVIFVGGHEGEVSVFDKIVPNRFFYTEPLPNFHWQLTDDTLTVSGYLCQKAVGHYGGRTWIAWYTEDVPAPYGPWKLRGLPGMILKAEDADGIFRFDFAGLERKSERMNGMDKSGYTTIKRNKFIRQRNKLLCNKRYVQNPRYYIPDGAYDHLNIVEMWPGGPEPPEEDKVSVVATDMIIPKKANVYQPLEVK